MRVSRLLLLVLPSLLAPPLTAPAQTAATLSSAATPATAVPPLIPYSGQIQGLSGRATATFLIYKDETGGEPLFAETQTAVLDSSGRYQVQLGATLASGLPTDLFATGEARWLEVQVAGEAPRARVPLVSVPYALKAADAATLGGLPASAFALAGSSVVASSASPAAGVGAQANSNVTTPGGTAGYLPLFTGAATIGDSIVFQNSNGIGINNIPYAALDVTGKTVIRGNLDLGRTGNPTTATGFPTYPLTFHPGVYSSSSSAAVYPVFQWQAEPIGNNTASPSATFNLLTAPTSAGTPAETGFYFNLNGTIHFAAGQTFPGGGGSGTITGVTAGTGLTGGGTTGVVTLNVDATKVPLLTASNSFAGNQAITAGSLTLSGGNLNLPVTTSANSGVISIGGVPFLHGYTAANLNAFVGGAGNFTTTGQNNVGVGLYSLKSQTSGSNNTGVGISSLASDTTGSANTAIGEGALAFDSSGGSNTAVGDGALVLDTTGSQNTAVGVASLQAVTTGGENTAVGAYALGFLTTATGNTAVGSFALENTTTGGNSTGVGWEALMNETTGGNNTALGASAGVPSTGGALSGTTAVGAFSTVNQNNSLVLGYTSATTPGEYYVNVGVGTATPRSTVELAVSAPANYGPVLTLTNTGGALLRHRE